ncbi:hypothetical protein LM7423_140135 [Listeria monocytogenes]|nr:hypothetical protein LM7423_140135 [Listeria monocytogenes]CUL82592.1 hypothetical protein LM7425_130197 [Listeria monocytogenes]
MNICRTTMQREKNL